MGRAMIVEAVRTPVGKRGGVLAGVHPAELLGGVQAGPVSHGALRGAQNLRGVQAREHAAALADRGPDRLHDYRSAHRSSSVQLTS